VAASPDLFPRSSGSQFGHPLIQGEIYTDFLQDAVKRTEQIKHGHPLDTDTMIGAQASNDQLEKILSYIDIGRQEGAKILTGGERVGLGGELAGGYYMRPTIFEGNNAMRIFQEEIFGPVVSVARFSDYDDAIGIGIANDTLYGLGAAVWSRDGNVAYRAGRDIQAGLRTRAGVLGLTGARDPRSCGLGSPSPLRRRCAPRARR
jgi:aldehyde dehydrogenase